MRFFNNNLSDKQTSVVIQHGGGPVNHSQIMRKIKKTRLSDSVIEAIKETISEENFKPGDKFYSENELTKTFGVSRSSIREAVKILEAIGQVEVIQGKGIYIADMQGQRFKAFSTWLKTNEQAIKDNFEVRLIIEPKTARYAAQKADKADLREIEETHAQFVKFAGENNTEDAIVCDGRFHRLLAKTTKNTTLYFLMKAMTTKMPTGWISSLYTPGRMQKTIAEHGDILKTIKDGDQPGAENAMTRHLVNALHDITTQLDMHSS